jgi:hypothetical protein
MTDLNERELRRRFAEIRASDSASTPSFDATIGRQRSRPAGARSARRVYPMFAVAATVVFAFGLCLKGGSSQPSTASPPSVAEWQPASDVLLGTARPALFGPMPPLGSSVLDSFLR